MSDSSQGSGWWVASDGKWYPPEQAPGFAVPAPVAATAPVAAGQPDPGTGQPIWDGTQWVYPGPVSPPGVPPLVQPAPVKAKGRTGMVLGVAFLVIVLIAAGAVVVVRSRTGGSTASGGSGAGDVASGPDELPSDKVKLTDKAVVVRGNGGKTLKSIASDGSTFTLDGSAQGIDQLQAGKVLLLTGVTVVKVTDVQRNGGDVVVKTEAAAITDVISDGEISWDKLEAPAGTLHVWDAKPEDVTVKDPDSSGGGAPTTTEPGSPAGSGTNESTTPESAPNLVGPRLTAPPSPPHVTGISGLAGFGGFGQFGALGGGVGSVGAASVPPLPTGSARSIFGVHTQAAGDTKSGKVGGFDYSYTKTPHEDGGNAYKITVAKNEDFKVLLTIEAEVSPLITSGDISVSGGKLSKFKLQSDKLEGKASVQLDAGTGDRKEPVAITIVKVPISYDIPIVIYGIPFNLSISGNYLLQPAFTSKTSTVGGKAEVSFGGPVGLTYEGGILTANGSVDAKKVGEPIDSVTGIGVGATGFVFAAQFPRIQFGLGWAASNAGPYIDEVLSVGVTLAPAIGMVPCQQINVTNTVSAGIAMKFIGLDLPELAKKEISKKSYSAFKPEVKACKIDG